MKDDMEFIKKMEENDKKRLNYLENQLLKINVELIKIHSQEDELEERYKYILQQKMETYADIESRDDKI
jgi:hypothetical protein